ncbi:MAG: hypothetical protein IIZ55_09720, partial [Firmicutes bacterium]|nr:hypothetical protein [Bacillota bacterium]
LKCYDTKIKDRNDYSGNVDKYYGGIIEKELRYDNNGIIGVYTLNENGQIIEAEFKTKDDEGFFDGYECLYELIPRDAEALLPYPYIREKLEDGRQQALSDLYKRSLRAGAAGGPMITISLSGPGGPDGSA